MSYYSAGPLLAKTAKVYEQSSTAQNPVGAIYEALDGSRFMYCKDSGSGLTVAHIASAPLADGIADAVAGVAHPIGTSIVQVTPASTITAGQFADGFLWINQGTGIGDTYRIKSNPAITGSAAGYITLWEPLRTAWSASDTDIMIFPNPANGTLAAAYATNFYKPVGVALRTITASYYYWAMVRGYTAIKLDVASAGGLELDEKDVVPSPNHAGQGYIMASPGQAGYHHVGYLVGLDADITDDDAMLCYVELG